MSDDEPELPPELNPRGPRSSSGVPKRPSPKPAPPPRPAARPAARTPRTPPREPVGRSERGTLPPRPVRPTALGPVPFRSEEYEAAVLAPAEEVVPRGPRRSRRAVARRVLASTAITMSVVMLAITGLGYFYVQGLDGNINRIGPISLRPDDVRPDEAPRDARNVLLIGSDSRANSSGIDSGSGATSTSGQRADTIILAHLYGNSDAAQLVSFPRDSWVKIPTYTDPRTKRTRPARMAKINSAIAEGGIPLLVATLEDLTGIRIDNFLVIDFAGFQAMVNKLGGVEVCLLQPAKEKDSEIDLQAGRQTISGKQALAFVRQRKELPRGDIDRIARQQHFIGALIREVLTAGTLLNPAKLNGFLNTLTSNVSTDDSLDFDELVKLGLRLRSFSSGGVGFTTVPFTDINGRRNGQSVVLLDDAKVSTLFAGLRADRPPGQLAPRPKPTTAVPTVGLFVPPTSIRVKVFNGGGTQGAGRKAAEDLAGRGFVIQGTPENRGTGASTTVVRYGPDKADSARTLAASIPGATLELDRALTRTLEVVVGLDYAGTQAVTIGKPPATATPEPEPGAAEPLATAATAGCVN